MCDSASTSHIWHHDCSHPRGQVLCHGEFYRGRLTGRGCTISIPQINAPLGLFQMASYGNGEVQPWMWGELVPYQIDVGEKKRLCMDIGNCF